MKIYLIGVSYKKKNKNLSEMLRKKGSSFSFLGTGKSHLLVHCTYLF